MVDWKPEAYPSLSPYLICSDAEGLIDFLGEAFDGVVQRRFDHPDGRLKHAEVRIDDSVVMIGGGVTDETGAAVHIHLYVEDVTAVFERAVAAGADTVQEPRQASDDDDVRGGVRDRWGITWWIASQRATP